MTARVTFGDGVLKILDPQLSGEIIFHPLVFRGEGGEQIYGGQVYSGQHQLRVQLKTGVCYRIVCDGEVVGEELYGTKPRVAVTCEPYNPKVTAGAYRYDLDFRGIAVEANKDFSAYANGKLLKLPGRSGEKKDTFSFLAVYHSVTFQLSEELKAYIDI